MKGTRHNGRSGKDGVYNPLHNDRRFDPEHSEHIDNERVRQNIYWDCYQGYTTMADRGKEDNFSFNQIEMAYYVDHYSDYVINQNKRHEKARHPDRCKGVEDVLKNKKTCPEESIYQLGTIDEHASVETLVLVFDEFKKEFDERFGSNVHIIDWSLHMDEATPHIHERHASDFVYEVVKHFLMEALSRIYRPGCKADEMLCLVGQQGAGKSTFFRFLALNDDWFSDDLKQLNDSKIYEHLRGHWIMEMSEMIAAISAKSNEEIKSFLTRQKDTYRNPYDKYEEDRKRQCIFAGSTNTRQFIPFDRTGARRFLPIAIDSSKAEKHILDDEKEARSYFDQLWAEAMEIYWSTENKSSLLKFSKEMEQEISEYRKQFTQEDTMAGMIQGWLDAYKGSHVCSVQIWKEAFDHFDREPKKFETNEICSIMDTQITGWKRAGVHRFSKEGYGRQRSWIREGAEEEGGNEPDKDGFTKLTKAEQLELPFDLPDREKG